MPIQRPRPDLCIFCTFRRQVPRAHSRLPQWLQRATRTSSFSTVPRLQRTASPLLRKTYVASKNGKDWTASKGPVLRKVTAHSTPHSDSTQIAYDQYRKSRFKRIVLDRLDAIEPKLKQSPLFQQPGLTDVEIDRALGQFRWYVRQTIGDDTDNEKDDRTKNLRYKLVEAMKQRGQNGLDSELQYALYNHYLGKNFTSADINNQRSLADLRYPTEWFPVPRTLHRTIHAHIGPTNSGKTYHALQRLELAKAGLYAGPLRLLAHEVYSRLNAKGKLCALVTGEEQRLPDGWQEAEDKVVAATVEMTNLNSVYDVAVIDEIQMLGSPDRGFAWTQALLGVQSKEIHVCGEVRALPIIRELAAAAGDRLVVHEYDRLTQLKMDTKSLNGSLRSLRKGDCIVTFSVVNIHALRTEVEKKTGKKAAVVYGSLPPETRAQQARLFNDPDNDYDFLIASDAVGMGLNLSIKRIIFETVHKYTDGRFSVLSTSEIRQIAGRAGRYRTSHQAIEAANENKASSDGPSAKTSSEISAAAPSEETLRPAREPEERGALLMSTEAGAPNSNLHEASLLQSDLSSRAEFDHHTVGLVTTIDSADFEIVREALGTEPPPLTFATIQPPAGIIQRFASYFPPSIPLSYILLRLTELSDTAHRYKIYHKPDMIMMADLLHGVEGLSTEDRMIFINAPASIRDPSSPLVKLLRELAECIGSQRGGGLLALKHMKFDVLDEPSAGTHMRLKALEELHKGLVLYLWLSFRFPGVFTQRPLGNHVKEMVEHEIEETLRLMTFLPNVVHRKRQRKKSMVEDEIMRAIREEEALQTREQEPQKGEPGFASPGAEAIVSEVDILRLPADGGEWMPRDDEGEYPDDGEIDNSNNDAAFQEDPTTEKVHQYDGARGRAVLASRGTSSA